MIDAFLSCGELTFAAILGYLAGALTTGVVAAAWHALIVDGIRRRRAQRPMLADDCAECPLVGMRARTSRLDDPMAQPVDYIRP